MTSSSRKIAMKIELNKSFSSRVERSERVIKVAEAFGLGLEERQWTVLDNIQFEVVPGDVVYISGQSGAGKSVLLRELAMKLEEKFSVARIEDVTFTDQPVIDQIANGVTQDLAGKVSNDSMAEAIRLLSIVGISDAYLYIRKPTELSDGQRYRMRLAKLIETGADVWIADEFGAVLDRVTAKVVAYNMAKVARQLGKILVVATTHTDLVDELAPSVKIVKRFHDRISIDEYRTVAD
jgi:ABC-type ATPase with predicted acetyltransferase domain